MRPWHCITITQRFVSPPFAENVFVFFVVVFFFIRWIILIVYCLFRYCCCCRCRCRRFLFSRFFRFVVQPRLCVVWLEIIRSNKIDMVCIGIDNCYFYCVSNFTGDPSNWIIFLSELSKGKQEEKGISFVCVCVRMKW